MLNNKITFFLEKKNSMLKTIDNEIYLVYKSYKVYMGRSSKHILNTVINSICMHYTNVTILQAHKSVIELQS